MDCQFLAVHPSLSSMLTMQGTPLSTVPLQCPDQWTNLMFLVPAHINPPVFTSTLQWTNLMFLVPAHINPPVFKDGAHDWAGKLYPYSSPSMGPLQGRDRQTNLMLSVSNHIKSPVLKGGAHDWAGDLVHMPHTCVWACNSLHTNGGGSKTCQKEHSNSWIGLCMNGSGSKPVNRRHSTNSWIGLCINVLSGGNPKKLVPTLPLLSLLVSNSCHRAAINVKQVMDLQGYQCRPLKISHAFTL